MGAAASLDLRPEEIRELQDLTCYEPKEIQKLFKRFRRLDRGFRGTISAEDLIMVPELAMNPLAPRLVALFPRDAEDRINFTSFVTGLAVFSENCPAQRRIRAVFVIYDVDGDGFISEDDLRKVVSMLVGGAQCMMLQHMSDAALGEVVRRTMETADVDRDGRISFEDFSQSCALVPWDSLTVPVKSSSRQQVEIEVAMANAAQQNRSQPHDFS